MFRHSALRRLAKWAFAMRIPANSIHRALACEYWLRRFAVNELARILYYQPIFESACLRVGEGFRLQLCPESKVPLVNNVDLEVGRHTQLSARLTLSGAPAAARTPRIRIGDHCYLGDRCVLRAGNELVIGNHVLIGTNALISCDPGHPMEAKARRTRPAPADRLGRIEIRDDVWISYNVSVLGTVTIGQGAVVGANSVVVSDVPAFAFVAGNPARVVRMLHPANPDSAAAPSNKPGAAPGANVLAGTAPNLFEPDQGRVRTSTATRQARALE